jgi:hypothetical protein
MDFMYQYEIEKKKLLAIIALSGVASGLKRRKNGGDATNIQHKPKWNCRYEFPLYNEYNLIKTHKER